MEIQPLELAVCECTITNLADPIDPEFLDHNCNGSDGVVDACIYVSASAPANRNGSRSNPVSSIAEEILLATNELNSVCLSRETDREPVVLASGVHLFGGFDAQAGFVRSSLQRTEILAPGTALLAQDLTRQTEVQGLTIVAESPAAPGQSTYGVQIVSADVVMRDNVITAERGSDGTDADSPGTFVSLAIPGRAGGKGGDGGVVEGSVGCLVPQVTLNLWPPQAAEPREELEVSAARTTLAAVGRQFVCFKQRRPH